MNVITVVGARPQFVKAAIVSRALAEHGVGERILHTGQHFDPRLSDLFFDELEIDSPVWNLGIGGGTHGSNTGRMLEGVEGVLLKERPDVVCVYGDTDSTLARALAAVKLHIPLVHVEAGLRSFNRRMPEEINRILTDHCADVLFTPTPAATEHLVAEGIAREKIEEVGDVMYDASLFFGRQAERNRTILSELALEGRPYVLATIHRQENTDDPLRLKAIFSCFAQIAAENTVVLPLHPRTKHKLAELDMQLDSSPLVVIEPVGYLDMLVLEKNAKLIVTDSGGVQKEAYFNEVPCVTLRDETEWNELVELGWNRLASPASDDLYEYVLAALDTRGRDAELFGGGNASRRIASRLARMATLR